MPSSNLDPGNGRGQSQRPWGRGLKLISPPTFTFRTPPLFVHHTVLTPVGMRRQPRPTWPGVDRLRVHAQPPAHTDCRELAPYADVLINDAAPDMEGPGLRRHVGPRATAARSSRCPWRHGRVRLRSTHSGAPCKRSRSARGYKMLRGWERVRRANQRNGVCRQQAAFCSMSI